MEAQALVDVREMLCAQALAKAEAAMRRLQAGEVLDVLCNAEDVKTDLLIWVREVGHSLIDLRARGTETLVRIRKGRSKNAS